MITSPLNKRVAKAVRLKKRAVREKEGRFLVEGVPAVGEALGESTTRVGAIFHVSSGDDRVRSVLDRARSSGVEIVEVSADLMGRLTSTVTPQGVVAVADFVDVPLDDLRSDVHLVPVLVEVRDPGNAGAIIRSADAAGADAVVLTTASVDLYNEKAVRASAGSLFHLPVVREVSLTDAVSGLRAKGLRVVGASANGEVSVYEADLTPPTAVLFGNEAHGLPAEALSLLDQTVRVPIHGRAESLNLAAATALVLFEAARQRAGPHPLAPLVTGAAHDIRSPLASMVGFTHTMLARWDTLRDEQKLAMIGMVAFDAGRMRTLLAQLVDAASLSSGGVELSIQPMDLLETARRVSDELSHPDLPPIEVTGSPSVVEADPKRIAIIFGALIEACRWWGETGPVRVAVGAEPRPLVEVTRTGTRPLPEGDQLLSPRDPGSGGGGKVALFVAKGLAEAHGATLEAGTEGGIVFRLSFPAA